MFFIIFWGNIRTTGIVVFQKLDSKDRAKLQYRVMGQRDSSASKNQVLLFLVIKIIVINKYNAINTRR